MPNEYYKIYNENSGPLELSLVLPLNKSLLFWNKKITPMTSLPPSYFLNIYEKIFFIYLMISYEAFS